MIRVRLISLKAPTLFIQSIKALRHATALGLKETKDICDAMRNYGKTPEVTFYLDDSRALVHTMRDEIDKYFQYEILNQDRLKLYMCKSWRVFAEGRRTLLVLAMDESKARDIGNRAQTPETVGEVTEIVGPFKEGTILADFTQ